MIKVIKHKHKINEGLTHRLYEDEAAALPAAANGSTPALPAATPAQPAAPAAAPALNNQLGAQQGAQQGALTVDSITAEINKYYGQIAVNISKMFSADAFKNYLPFIALVTSAQDGVGKELLPAVQKITTAAQSLKIDANNPKPEDAKAAIDALGQVFGAIGEFSKAAVDIFSKQAAPAQGGAQALPAANSAAPAAAPANNQQATPAQGTENQNTNATAPAANNANATANA